MHGSKLAGPLLAGALLALPAAGQQPVTLPATDRPLSLATRTLFTLGELDGADHESFAMVTDVAFDADGNVYVLDSQAYRVSVFDAGGRFLRSIGRQGGGPGEFTFPSGIALLPDGSLVVNDGGRASLQIFDSRGAFVRSIAIDDDLGRALGRLRASQSGSVLTETARFRTPGRAATGDRLSLPPRSITALMLDSVARGTRLFNAPPRELSVSTQNTANGGGTRFSMALSAFLPELLWTPFAEAGVAVSNSAAWRVVIADGQGRPTRYLERAIEPRKVTGADRKRWLERRSETGGGTAMIMTASRSGSAPRSAPPPPAVMRVDAGEIDEQDVNWGDVVPVIAALGTDSFGRLWVQRAGRDLGAGPIDVIDSDLRYLGTLAPQEMPRAFGPDGRVAYIVRDDLDVQRVVVKQIIR